MGEIIHKSTRGTTGEVEEKEKRGMEKRSKKGTEEVNGTQAHYTRTCKYQNETLYS